MALTESELKRIRTLLIDAAKKADRLTGWEDTFLVSIKRGVDAYKADIYLSERQWDVIRRIEEKVYQT